MPLETEKITVRRFKNSEHLDFWVSHCHYRYTTDKEIILCAGGTYKEQEVNALKAYLKRNKLL